LVRSAWDASDGARQDATAGVLHRRLLPEDAGAGKWADRERDDRARDALCRPVHSVAREEPDAAAEPCTPDGGQFAARSFAVLEAAEVPQAAPDAAVRRQLEVVEAQKPSPEALRERSAEAPSPEAQEV